MFETFRPLGDRVLVERIEAQERTAGGLIIPDSAKEKSQTGRVIAVGTGRRDASGAHLALDVKINDIVYFGKYAGTEVDKNHIILKEDDLLGVSNL